MPAEVTINPTTAVVTIPPQTAVVVSATASSATVVVTPSGIQGPQGVPGPAASTLIEIAGEALSAGQPVYVAADGKAYQARADTYSKSSVIGLAAASCVSGVSFSVERNALTLADWTGVAGVSALVRGAVYFLGLGAGSLTQSAPSTQSQSIIRVGIASGAQTLTIQLGDLYLL